MKVEFDIKQKLYKEISEYCKVNNISNIDKFVEGCISGGFNIIRFGISPIDNLRRERDGINNFPEVKEQKKKVEEVIVKQDSVEEKKDKPKKIRIIKKDLKND